MADDGWTHITSKKGKRTTTGRQYASPSTLTHYDRDATVDSLSQQFNKIQQRWFKSDVFQHVLKVFNSLRFQDESSITKGICLGIGVFSTSNLDARNRSMIQLAVFMAFINRLKAVHGNDIELKIQEPRFAELDREFLAAFGFQVLDCKTLSSQSDVERDLGPAARHLGQNAFVADFFMDHTPRSIRQLFESRSQYVLTAAHRLRIMPDPSKELENQLREWLHNYRSYDLVLPNHDTTFELALHGLQALAFIPGEV